MFPLFRLLLVFGLGLTVQAAVGARALFGQREDLRQLLLNGGDAAGILAADDVGDALGQLELALCKTSLQIQLLQSIQLEQLQ